MSLNDKTPDHHVAFGAANEGFAAASASLTIVGRYWWNLQMRLLAATGTIRFFKIHWWLFLIVGFLLLAFVLPLGLAFVVSAFCASDPKAKDNFIVPLRQEDVVLTVHSENEPLEGVAEHSHSEVLEDMRLAASLHHIGYLRGLKLEVSDSEFAATALGAFDGTVQAIGLKLSDLDMHTMGAAFIAGQLKDLDRMGEVDPEWLADITMEAMTSGALEAIRLEASRMAYTMERAMQDGPAPYAG